MTEPVIIYHNPRCSKSCATLELLQHRGITPEIVEYLEKPPTVAELQQLLGKLQRSPAELVRSGESLYRELGLGDAGVGDGQLIDAMHRHPILIERPIVVRGSRAAIGRPPTAVLELL